MAASRFVVTKGDFGFRIYDRETKHHVKTKAGLVAWYKTRQSAQNAIGRIRLRKLGR